MVIRRKVEIHRLIISGLPQDEEYGALLRRIRQRVSRLQDLVLAYGSRSHLLYSAATTTRGRMRMRFISYTTGFRPDIFDTQSFSLGQNPLGANQTGVDWTQVIGGDVRNRYLLAVERGRNLTAPGTIERYLQWLLGAYYEPE